MISPVPKKKPQAEARGPSSPSGFQILTHYDNVCRLGALGALGDVKLDFVAFVKDLKPVLLDGRKVNKDVISVISGNEPIALLFIKPFYTTFGHYNSPPLSSELL